MRCVYVHGGVCVCVCVCVYEESLWVCLFVCGGIDVYVCGGELFVHGRGGMHEVSVSE